jgi:dihydrofolate synthase/folylpolyglutamate synthase
MVEAIARRAGLRTGLTTSPHLSRFAERIRIDGAPIGDRALEAALSAVLEGIAVPLTFFEALTAAAFVAFRDAGVDLMVLEVGLGGRLDATNVVEAPLCAAITSIALEHAEILGPTIAHIAREKAGILKPGAPVVLGPLDPEAAAPIEEVARAVSAGPIWRVARAGGGEAAAPRPGEIRVRRRGAEVEVLAPPEHGGRAAARLGLEGPHQADNAAVACGIAWRLAARWPAVAGAIPEGLGDARWPGRLERLRVERGAEVLLDCAHNPHGALALAAALDEGATPAARTTLVFGALADKDYPGMLAALAPRAGRRLYTTPKGRAAAPLAALQAIAPGEAVPEPRAALARALEAAAPGDLVVVTGSIYLVGEVRSALLGIEPDPVIAL